MFRFAIAVPEHRNTNEAGEIKIYPSIPIYTHPLSSPRLNTTQSSAVRKPMLQKYPAQTERQHMTFPAICHLRAHGRQMTRVSGVLILNSVQKIHAKIPQTTIQTSTWKRSQHIPGQTLFNLCAGVNPCKSFCTSSPRCILLTHHPQTRHAIPRRSDLITDIRTVAFLNHIMGSPLNGRMTPICRFGGGS
jgi:hypothetical protein